MASRQRKCKVCKTPFIPPSNEVWCSVECGTAIAMKKVERNRMIEIAAARRVEAQKRREWNEEKKNILEARKNDNDHKNEVQKLVNEIARLIDKDLPCICCDKYGAMYAGHRIAAGEDKKIRLNLHNLHIQCYQCNVPKSANKDKYNIGLASWYGEDYVGYVTQELSSVYSDIQMSIPLLINAKSECKKIISELKKANLSYTPLQRYRMRTVFNKRIGIYIL